MKKVNELTLKDIPQQDIDKFIKILAERDQEYKRLIDKYMILKRSLRLAEAARVRKQMTDHAEMQLRNLLIHAKCQAVQMIELFKDMEDEDIEEINTKINSIMLLSDMIETFSMDVNHIVNKYHPDYRVEMYERFAELGQEAHRQMQFMSEVSEDIYQYTFADIAENITEMVLNKAKAMSRRIRQKREQEER